MGLVVRHCHVLGAFLLIVGMLTAGMVRASDAGVFFQRGIEEAERGDWSHAVVSFEQALALEDRPSLRFNLVLAYAELGNSLAVVQHALVFLSLPTEPHRAEARTKVEQAFTRAQQQLARLDTKDVPAEYDLTVDGAAPIHQARVAYVLPGKHVIALRAADGEAEEVELTLAAGSVQPWPRTTIRRTQPLPPVRLPDSSPATAPSQEQKDDLNLQLIEALRAQQSRMRKRLAWSLGIAGGLGLGMGLATYLAADGAAGRMAASDPFTEGPKFISSYDEYLTWRRSTIPFAAAGSALTSAALAVGERTTSQQSPVWAWSAFGTGTALLAGGLMLAIREPDLIENSSVAEPSRQAGAVLMSTAIPLLTYAVKYAFRHRRDDAPTGRQAKIDIRWPH